MRRNPKLVRVLPIAILPLFLTIVACGDSEGSTASDNRSDEGGSNEAQSGETITIGYIGTLSGPSSFLGEAPRQGVELAVNEINEADGIEGCNARVELISEDDEFDPAKGVAAAQKLISQDQVDVIIGSAHSGVTLAIQTVTGSAGVPQITPLSSNNGLTDPVTPYMFRLWNKDSNIATKLLGFAAENFDKVGLLHGTDAFGQGGREALVAEFRDMGREFVTVEAFDLEAQDLTPQLTKLRDAGAEALIVQAPGPQAALTARNLEQLDYDIPIIGHPSLAQEGFPKLANGAEEGSIIIDGLDREKPAAEDFIAAYESEHGSAPYSFYPATGYDAVKLVAEALKLVDCDASKLRDGLEKIEGLEGVVGPPGAEMTYGPDDHDGYGLDAMIFKEMRNGQLVPYEPGS